MKRNAIVKSVMALMFLLGVFSKGYAQGQDHNYQWIGNDVSSVINNSNADMNTIYLYNVGTKKYLNIGSNWGTSISAYEVGMPLKITNNGDGTYTLQGNLATSDGNTLGFPNAPATPKAANKPNWDRVFCDRKANNANTKWTLEAVGNNNYKIYSNNGAGITLDGQTYLDGNRYLVVESQTGSNRFSYTYPQTVNNSNTNGLWKIVTLKDMKDAFKAQFASNEAPADASFLISDQDFYRSNDKIGDWVATGFTYKTEGSYSFNQGSNYTYYVGMGQRTAYNDGYQRVYGSYWLGSIRNLGNNSNANGKLTQSVTALKKGWYRVSCDGFYSADGNSNLSASIFANVENTTDGRSNVSAKLNSFGQEFTYTKEELTKTYGASDVETESPYVKAAKIFETGTYNNSILVYVPADNTKINIGIQVENSTAELDWTAFDNFQMKYCGDNDMVLDEEQESLDYITKQQLVATNAYTLILKRTMKPGQWNSITLPVALTAAQFKTAFGDKAKLAKLKGQDPTLRTRIAFESVDLRNDAAIVIQPNKLYIMKSTRSASVTEGEYSKTLSDNSILKVKAPYFTINNVVLDQTPSETFKEDPKSTTTESNKIQFCGTNIHYTTPIVPAQSYVLGGKDGKWHHTVSALPIKGFRCWIATNVTLPSAGAFLTFAIDGKLEGTLTAINGLEQDQSTARIKDAVYNLQGQKVASNATEIDSLPAGIYIVNNKKIFIK